ncbi:MAG: type II secretion system protein N [Pseudomonadales bacterium]
MKRYLLVGILVLLAVVIYAAPASLLKQPLAAAGDLRVSQLQGTLWNGSGAVNVQNIALGTLRWQFAPARLLKAQAAFDYTLQGDHINLTGSAGRSFGPWLLEADGNVGSALVNQYLATYEIRMDGDLHLNTLALQASGHPVEQLSGSVDWPGGLVSYPVPGGQASRTLPPLRADLSLDADNSEPLANVHSESVNFPLISLRVLNSGFVKISLTRRFTQIVGMPWPGSEPDHAFVLEVEEQVF